MSDFFWQTASTPFASREKILKLHLLPCQLVEGLADMTQHIGDFVVTNIAILSIQVTGVLHVKRGGKLVASGELLGGLIVDAGGHAVVSAKIGRNVVNEGKLNLNGPVAGRILGKGAIVMGPAAHVSGNDLPVQPAPESSTA